MKKILLSILGLVSFAIMQAQQHKPDMQNLIQENFDFAKKQYLVLRDHTPADRMPQYFDANKNKWVSSDTKWWCSGFYPGSLLYIYEYTKDTAILNETYKRLAILEKEKHFTGNHDLGFMMFCSFGNAYRILGNPEYKTTVDTAAASLSTRYRPSIKAIQSWNKSKNFECPVIIDNMMNLELLSWVSDHGGDPKYKEIAITHANTTIKNHFRPDYSSYHVIDYDLNTGNVLKKKTWQGYSDASSWSRGQSWGFYGYTMMYRFTKNKAYLKQAEKIAQFILKHPNMPSDGVPYWDFNAPKIPNELRDASAASVLASGLLELGQYVSKSKRKKYVAFAEKIIRSLSSAQYRAALGENGGYLLKHSVGAIPFKSEVDTPLTYADYYFLEALLRYKNWYL
ncbi:MAG: glucuronyl hydrolase [Chitinophagaceae bacterium]|nr:MAG: glucuronyl hydrolase [Chitinophagaceae bacterium]